MLSGFALQRDIAYSYWQCKHKTNIHMTHFGIICPATTGHLNPMSTLGVELQRRGHRVTLFGILDAQQSTLAAGLEFRVIGKSEFPLGAMAEIFAQQGKLSGFAAIRCTVTWLTLSGLKTRRFYNQRSHLLRLPCGNQSRGNYSCSVTSRLPVGS